MKTIRCARGAPTCNELVFYRVTKISGGSFSSIGTTINYCKLHGQPYTEHKDKFKVEVINQV